MQPPPKPIEIRREWKGAEILWEACPDGTARVRPAPDVMALFGAARSATPRDAREKTRAREAMGRGGRAR